MVASRSRLASRGSNHGWRRMDTDEPGSCRRGGAPRTISCAGRPRSFPKLADCLPQISADHAAKCGDPAAGGNRRTKTRFRGVVVQIALHRPLRSSRFSCSTPPVRSGHSDTPNAFRFFIRATREICSQPRQVGKRLRASQFPLTCKQYGSRKIPAGSQVFRGSTRAGVSIWPRVTPNWLINRSSRHSSAPVTSPRRSWA